MAQKTTKRITGRKREQYNALISELGNVTAACKKSGIPRKTHYNWMQTDEFYKALIEDLPDICVDFAENSLMQQIREKNTTATIFYLKTKGKNRGYVERQEIEHSGHDMGVTVQLIPTSIEDIKKEKEEKSNESTSTNVSETKD